MSDYGWIDELIGRLGFFRSAKRVWNPPSARDFARVEGRLGGALPEAYKFFLSRYGGGILGTDDHGVSSPINEECPWGTTVQPMRFHALDASSRDSLEAVNASYERRVPKGVIAICRDLGGNEICLDVAGMHPGTVWFWDHEQRWFKLNLEDAAQEVEGAGGDARHMTVHDIIRSWARLHEAEFDRPADYVGMYRMAETFEQFLRDLQQVAR